MNLVDTLQREILELHKLLKSKENLIYVLKQQNLDLYLKLQKYSRKKKLKI